jgi:hypothetical protein
MPSAWLRRNVFHPQGDGKSFRRRNGYYWTGRDPWFVEAARQNVLQVVLNFADDRLAMPECVEGIHSGPRKRRLWNRRKTMAC